MSLMVLGSLVGGEVVPKLSSAQVVPQLHLIPDPTHPGQLRAGPWGAVGRGRGEICLSITAATARWMLMEGGAPLDSSGERRCHYGGAASLSCR